MKLPFLGALTLLHTALAALSIPELVSLSKQNKNGIIPLNDDNYADLLNGERDYHVIVYLATDSPQINCALCREFKPDFETVAFSWNHDHGDGLTRAELAEEKEIAPKNVFFMASDFVNSKKFFSLFKLDNIPKVFYFPPTQARTANNFISEKVDYQFFAGSHKDLLMGWFHETTGHAITEHVPPDYARIALNAVGTFSIVLLVRKFHSHIASLVSSRLLWSGISLVAVLLLTTGYMFNQIRGTPYVREHQNGVEYFAPGQQQQYAIETQIVSFLYGMLSLLVIVLYKKAPTIKSPSVNLVAVVVVSALIFLTLSGLLTVFGKKGMGYPYKMLELF